MAKEACSTHPRILITGASGALGRELAFRLARPGASLSLWGRDAERLEAVADGCRARGAYADARSLDLTDLDAALAALKQEDATVPFDMAFLVAGQGDTLPPGAMVEDPAQVTRLCQVNFVAPAAIAAAIAERMVARGRGRIALVGTAAASHSLPFAATYAGSKAGLARYADALRLSVKGHGVSVTLVSPGFFIDTRAGGTKPSMPGEISAGRVAEKMIAAVLAGRAELSVPRRFLLLRWFDRLLPRPLRDKILLSLRLP
ncbi:SDR family NAD(P)-dependent oxidoreductase [Erythrobacter mangrovi]|uniref:SDR family NAD(P)-dependent oxidoreductase n=1 Tax=Erythrobacter mangrovi TaxID=2739433 RepID=A0A7D3XIN0_9SPHN|nr:SDR family NAD(P)-dependent oxidoreductase [Erythrobacter mangrovi]QKG72293.1 SDR family NAD(P)-dependent oxidoreductase [Erythrobacter mangrovi]